MRILRFNYHSRSFYFWHHVKTWAPNGEVQLQCVFVQREYAFDILFLDGLEVFTCDSRLRAPFENRWTAWKVLHAGYFIFLYLYLTSNIFTFSILSNALHAKYFYKTIEMMAIVWNGRQVACSAAFSLTGSEERAVICNEDVYSGSHRDASWNWWYLILNGTHRCVLTAMLATGVCLNGEFIELIWIRPAATAAFNTFVLANICVALSALDEKTVMHFGNVL